MLFRSGARVVIEETNDSSADYTTVVQDTKPDWQTITVDDISKSYTHTVVEECNINYWNYKNITIDTGVRTDIRLSRS